MFKGRSTIQLVTLAGLALAGTTAFADVRHRVSIPGFEDSAGGFGDRVDLLPGGAPGVRSGDLTSVGLTVTTLDGITRPACVGSGSNVARGSAFTDLGAHYSGTDTVRVQWQEVPSTSSVSFVNIIIKTTNGGALFPSSHPSGSPVVSWRWNIGATDPIDFRATTGDINAGNYIQEVRLNNATAYYSRNGGRSFYQSQIYGSGLQSVYYPNTPASGSDPAVGTDLLHAVFNDPGFDQSLVDDGANYVLLRYELAFYVPTPGTLGLLSCAMLTTARRRRSR
jgi:hypothetical protein